MTLDVTDIFTPNDQPLHTYVEREDIKIESALLDALRTPNVVTSISGPSKAGKTVTLRKVTDPDLLIGVSGASVRSDQDLWEKVLGWMGGALSETKTSQTTTAAEVAGGAGGEAGLPFVAKGKVEVSGTGSISSTSGKQEYHKVDAFQQVVKEIGGSDYIVFVDDFHYIERNIQRDIARSMKAIAEQGVNICVASVPHRDDDVVRANPELRGRLAAVDLTYWQESDLVQIARQGFQALNIEIEDVVINRLATEATGSPQLMQTLCLNLCFEKNIGRAEDGKKTVSMDGAEIQSTLTRSAQFANFSSLLTAIHAGPKQRGTERKQFGFIDGSTGDVYRAVLLAIKKNPRTLSFTYDQLLDRVKGVCTSESPTGSSIIQSLLQMHEISKSFSDQEILNWDEDILTLIEPYFLYYLRHSEKLAQLSKAVQI